MMLAFSKKEDALVKSVQSSHSDGLTRLRHLILEIAKALVLKPDQVRVEAIAQPDRVVLRLYVAPTDIGRVIGNGGRTAESFRTILTAVNAQYKTRFALDIAIQP